MQKRWEVIAVLKQIGDVKHYENVDWESNIEYLLITDGEWMEWKTEVKNNILNNGIPDVKDWN